MKARSWASSRKMEDVSLSPVCDSRLGDSRPGRPGCSSLGLSWIPAPEQRFGGRPGRELQGERQRLISTTQNYILRAERRDRSCRRCRPLRSSIPHLVTLVSTQTQPHTDSHTLTQHTDSHTLTHSWFRCDTVQFSCIWSSLISAHVYEWNGFSCE